MSAVVGRARRMWWIVAVALVAASVLAVPGTASAQSDDREVAFVGSGWGHGVGMSQFGAFARSLDGQNHQQILAAYYQGSSIGTLGSGGVQAVNEIFVNVASDQLSSRATIGTGPGAPSDGVDVTRGATTKVVQPGDWVEMTDENDAAPGGCRVEFSDGTDWGIGSCDLEIELTDGDGDPPYLVTLQSCRGGSCTYGWGRAIHFEDNASHDPGFPGFDVVVEISTDEYARGIAEVPYSWHVEALKTQAIAARSYAASRAVAVAHTATTCWCDVRNDSFDQVYAGWVRDRPFGTAWDAAALATNSQVVAHPGSAFGGIVRTYYSSSNGGASERSSDKWGGPYYSFLDTVDDPWSLTPENPYAAWTVKKPLSDLAGWLGISDLRGASVIARNASGSPKTFEFTGFDASGALVEETRSVESVRARYGLRSWYFEVVLDPALNSPPVAGAERVGVHDPRSGIWHLRNGNGSVTSFYYGNPKDIPYAGDWDGDGDVTLGLYRQSTGFLFLRNSNTQGIADIQIFYGNPGDLPIAGDWDGDGIETVGIFRPSEARFYLRNTNTQGTGDLSFAFGERGDVPIAGDWNGDGIDTVGLYRPSTKTVYLANSNTNVKADFTWVYSGAGAGDEIIAGDWNGDGIDTVGIFRTSEAKFYLRDGYAQPSANIVFEMGESFMNPVAGWWGS